MLPNKCIQVNDLEQSTAVFTTVSEFPVTWHESEGLFGLYEGGLLDLGLGLVRGIDDPIFLPFRGLYFDGFNDFMRLSKFVFSSQASVAVVMRKPRHVVGTLFSFDTDSRDGLLDLIEFNELALSFEGDGSECRCYNDKQREKFTLAYDTDAWVVVGFSWSWANGAMSFTLAID